MNADAVHALAAEGGEQGGVHVDDAAAIARDDLGRHQLEKSRQHEQVHRLRLERREPLVGAAPVRERQRGDSALPGPVERGRLGAVAQHQDDAGLVAVSEAREERFEIAARDPKPLPQPALAWRKKVTDGPRFA